MSFIVKITCISLMTNETAFVRYAGRRQEVKSSEKAVKPWKTRKAAEKFVCDYLQMFPNDGIVCEKKLEILIKEEEELK